MPATAASGATHRRRPTPPVVLLIHLLITLPLACALPIWSDEAYSLHTTGGGLGHALSQSLSFELQPPLYFLLLASWRSLDPSIFWARLLSVACAAGTVLVAGRLSRRLFPSLAPGWLMAAVAFNPLVVWAALEIRLYALLILLSALLLLFFPHAFVSERFRPAYWGAYVATATAILYTQYLAGFLLAASAVVLVLERRWLALCRYALAMGITALLFLPLGMRVPEQFSFHTEAADRAPFRQGLSAMAYRLQEYVLPGSALLDDPALVDPRWTRAAHWGARIVVLVILGGVLLRSATVRGFLRSTTGLWLLSTTASLALAFAALFPVVGASLLHPNHTAGLFLPALVTTFAIAAVLPGRVALPMWLVLVVGLGLPALLRSYAPLAKAGDVARVARHIAAHEQEGEPILVFPAEDALALRFYYFGPNAIVPLPDEPSLSRYDPRTFVIRSTDQLESRVASRPAAHGRRWMVISPARTHMGVPNRRELLLAYLAERFNVEDRRSFYRGLQVLYLSDR